MAKKKEPARPRMRTPRSPKLRIEVTAEIIKASIGSERDSAHCMIADAVRAVMPEAQKISADLATIRLTDPKRRLRLTYLTPRIAQVQLVNFDQGRKPEPFSFVLRGAHITRAGSTAEPRQMSEKEKQQRTEAGRKLNERLGRTKLVDRKRSARVVPDRVGGKTPPLQVGADGVPFSRRRAFGLRALEY